MIETLNLLIQKNTPTSTRNPREGGRYWETHHDAGNNSLSFNLYMYGDGHGDIILFFDFI